MRQRCPTGTVTGREEFLSEHLPLVYHVALQILRTSGSAPPLDELVGAGTVGLIQAMESYDASRDARFSTYAAVRIRGAILDDLRKTNGVPRDVRVKQRRISQARQSAGVAAGHAPTPRETAREIGIELETLHRWESDTARASTLSLDEIEGPGADRLSLSESGAHEALERKEEVARMYEELKQLPERERLVLSLSFLEDLKLWQIAEVLGVTEGRVSQIRSAALRKLRERLCDPDDDAEAMRQPTSAGSLTSNRARTPAERSGGPTRSSPPNGCSVARIPAIASF